MVQFSELAIPFVIFLIAINTMFAAMATLPGDQLGNPNQKLFASIANNPDMNDSIFTYVDNIDDDVNAIRNQGDTNNATHISIQNTDVVSVLFNIGNTITGGGLGYVVQFVGFITQMAFGYGIWLDYFFNPSWGPFVQLLGGIFKAFFFIVQLYALVSIFTALVGRRI